MYVPSFNFSSHNLLKQYDKFLLACKVVSVSGLVQSNLDLIHMPYFSPVILFLLLYVCNNSLHIYAIKMLCFTLLTEKFIIRFNCTFF